jgi:hypothetical protein
MKTLIERIEIAKINERNAKDAWDDHNTPDSEANMLIATAKLEFLYILSMVNKIKGENKDIATFYKNIANESIKTAQLAQENGCIEGVKDSTELVHNNWKKISKMLLSK